MPNSIREQLVDGGEGIYLLGLDEEEKASSFGGVCVTSCVDQVVEPQTEEDAPTTSHLKTTQQILDLLDEKLQSPLLVPTIGTLDRNNNLSVNSNPSTIQLDSKGSGHLKLTHYRRRRFSPQNPQNLDYYLNHAIKDSSNCSCRFERSCTQEPINHQCDIGNSWRYACCNPSESGNGIAVTLDGTTGSLEAQLTYDECDDDQDEVVSVNSLTNHSWKGCYCRLSESLIIEGVSCGEEKHYSREEISVKPNCSDKYRHPNNSSLLKSTSNKLAQTCPLIDTPVPYFHNPPLCYQTNSEPAKQCCNAKLTKHDKSNTEENVDDEEKYLVTLEARAKFDLVSEVGSALEKLADSEFKATTISPTNLLSQPCLYNSSFVGQHNLQLSSTEEARRGEHLDYCSVKLKSAETSLCCPQEETHIFPISLCLCVKCTNNNTSSIKTEDNCSGTSSRIWKKNFQSPATNYTSINDLRHKREYIYTSIKKNNSYEDIDIFVDDVEEVAKSSFHTNVSQNELSDSDINISLSDLSLNLNDGRSMRALKEIAKTSIPSISSLQHLPNRIKSSKLKRANSTGTVMETNSKRTKSTIDTSSVDASQESIHHESHLLNRLCLCNCIMKNSNIDNNDESLKKRANSECTSADMKSKSNCLPNSSNSLRNTSTKQTSARSGDDISLLKSTEKQSPAFFNLLLKSAVELKNGPFSLKHRTVSPSNHHQHQASTDDISSILSSGSGEFYSSSTSLSGGLKRRHLKSESSLLLSEQRASKAHASSDKRQDADVRPKSECSNVERTQRHVSTTRYLSLSRLFSSNKSSRTSSEATKSNANTTAETLNLSPDEPLKSCDQKRKSFLTKSLQRLSYRKKNNKSSNANQSPSTSSSSPNQSPLEYSTNSCEEIKSPSNCLSPVKSAQSQILIAPEIAIDHVEYCNISDSAKIRSRTTTDSMESYIADTESFCRTQSDLYDCNESTRGGLLVSDTDEGSFSLSSIPNYLNNNQLTTNINHKRSPRLSRSPVPFESPATHSSKIEDGLKVCSTEHFEKHIDNIKDTQIEAQKKLFKLWINYYCPNLICSDLVLELKDGIKLIGLIGSLTHDKQLLSTYSRLNRDRQTYINRIVTTPSSRLRHLSHVSLAINFLREKVGMKLINLNPMDIVSGKPNVILGLCWNIILNFQLEQNFLRCKLSREQMNDSGTDSSLSIDGSNRICTDKESVTCHEDYTQSYFLNAKKKVLGHINKRFNLKLTTLTSNLINGDVLLTILKQLSPEVACMEVIRGQGGQVWERMSNEDKLDCCFALAQAHLNIPCLFSARDLMRHNLDHNNFKPLLIYLSMLLSASSDLVNSQPQDDLINSEVEPDMNSFISSYLNDIDTSDKFYLAKLHFTIEKLRKLGDIIEAGKKEADKPQFDRSIVERYTKLRDQTKQVENLISWINEADNLIENTNSIPKDLKYSIVRYKEFFSESNIPHVIEQICPILMRQYRECLSNAKQKILSMEQTYKNWNSYETTSDKLKQWLALAELKLKEASETTESTEASTPVEHLTSLMQGIIDYFELEPISNIMSEELSSGSYDLMMNEDTISMTGSIASLNSNSSKILAFQGSPKATSTKLFEEFEIKTHLLATVLEPNQRENLLLAMKQLKRTLKYITKIQVPKVVNELRWSIIQLDSSGQWPRGELDVDDTVLTKDEIPEPSTEQRLQVEELIEQKVTPDITRTTIESMECRENLVNSKKVKVKVVKNENKSKQVKSRNSAKKPKDKVVVEEEKKVIRKKPWSFSSWLLGYSEPEVECQTKAKQTNCTTGRAKDTNIIKNESNLSYPKQYWSKLYRAYKTSLPLTIVLLICLAGVCVVPLINKNICCDFKLEHIPHENLDIGEKPT